MIFQQFKPYLKTIVAVVGGLATFIVATYGGDSTAGRLAAAVLFILTSFGVYQVKNAPLPPKAGDGPTG